MTNDVQQFYDDFAQVYEFIVPNWEQFVHNQGKSLSALLQKLGYSSDATIYDCTCGVGTQTFALAQHGYRVHGTDLSPQAIDRAKANIPRFKMPHEPTFGVANLLDDLPTDNAYDVVMSCDNSVAHFHSDVDLAKAIQNMRMQLKPNGLLLISMRDYDATIQNPSSVTPVITHQSVYGRGMRFQVWDWYDDYSAYDMEMFIIQPDVDGNYRTTSSQTTLRAWQRDDVTKVLQALGMLDITWHMPDSSNYYQPIVTARKP